MITIISRSVPPCPKCTAAKRLLELNEIDFKLVDISEYEGEDIRSLPTVFLNETRIGGLEELRALVYGNNI